MMSKRIGIVALIAIMAVAVAAQDASACWWRGCYGPRISYGYGWYGCGWDCCSSWRGCCPSYRSYRGYRCCGYCGAYDCCGSCVSSGCGCDSGGVYYDEGVETGPSMTPTPSPSDAGAMMTAPAMTKLTLHVPADARVTLAGSATEQQGTVRDYSTAKLPAGQTWNDYVVVAEVERNGQVYRQQRTITLTGGESQVLSIDFPLQQLAQVSR